MIRTAATQVLIPLMVQAGIEVNESHIVDGENFGTFMCVYSDVEALATLVAQKEQVQIIELLAARGIVLDQDTVEAITERSLEWE